jgi:hypothetical protein
MYVLHQTLVEGFYYLLKAVRGSCTRREDDWGQENRSENSPSACAYIYEGNSSKSLFWESEMYGKVVLWLLVALSLKSNASQPHDTSPLVTTAHGVLRGSVIQSRLGRPIYSFRGVRFAQPPVGNLRFKVRTTMASTWNRRVTPYFAAFCLCISNEKYQRDHERSGVCSGRSGNIRTLTSYFYSWKSFT